MATIQAGKRERPGAGSPPGRFHCIKLSIPSFHGLRHGSSSRRFAVLVVHMLQHCLGGLRASATRLVVELVHQHRVRTLSAVEGHATPTFGSPVDRVHDAEDTC